MDSPNNPDQIWKAKTETQLRDAEGNRMKMLVLAGTVVALSLAPAFVLAQATGGGTSGSGSTGGGATGGGTPPPQQHDRQ
jgi:hypothetical protein